MSDIVTKKLDILLQGKIPDKIDTGKIADESTHNLAVRLNQLIIFMQETHDLIGALSQGKLERIKFPVKNFFVSPFIELHSRLLHLTWQAKQVAKGDYRQRVDFMNDFSTAFNSMVIALENNETVLKRKIDELHKALSHIKRIEGVLPICANCKKIRHEQADPKNPDSWMPIENYISKKTEAQFTHSICPECIEKYYPEFVD